MTATILVVDDDVQVRGVMGRALREGGYPTTSTMARAEDGEAILASFDEDTRAQTLVLMDVSLHPGDAYPDGCAAGRAIVRQWPEVRVLFLSGHGSQAILDRCPGHPPYLTKPVPMKALLDIVRLTLGAPPWKPPADELMDRRRTDR